MVKDILVELCCGGIDDVITAARCGADRMELNCGMELGGLTPTISVLRRAKELTDIPICCMVRSRTAGFAYTREEFETMKRDAALLLENGADGLVFGFLNEDNTINKDWMKEMVKIAGDKDKVCHKAFDETPDKYRAAEDLIECGITRVLNMGGAIYPDLEEGLTLLGDLNAKYGKEIEFMPGGGVKDHNIRHILDVTGCKQIHTSARRMAQDNGEYALVDADVLRKMLEQI